MESPFEKLTSEERQDWFDSQATQAVYATLMQERSDLVSRLVDLIKDGRDPNNRLPHIGGQLTQVDAFLQLMRSKAH